MKDRRIERDSYGSVCVVPDIRAVSNCFCTGQRHRKTAWALRQLALFLLRFAALENVRQRLRRYAASAKPGELVYQALGWAGTAADDRTGQGHLERRID